MNLRIRRIIKSIFASVLVFIVFCGSALAASISCYINTNTKVYSSASTRAKYSLPVAKNMEVNMEACDGTWALIESHGNRAYIPVKYLTFEDAVKAYTAQSTKLYKSASSSSSYTRLDAGITVYIIGMNNGYFYVRNADRSAYGYIKQSHLSGTKPSSSPSKDSPSTGSPSTGSPSTGSPSKDSPSSNSEKIAYVVSSAEALLGTPYSTSPSMPKSFDCSRFVKYCYSLVGVSLSGSVISQGYDDSLTKISDIDHLRVGDIVCFNTVDDDDLCDHTGIYIGDGEFIHCSSAAGKVIISSLSSGYYERNFSWARRVF